MSPCKRVSLKVAVGYDLCEERMESESIPRTTRIRSGRFPIPGEPAVRRSLLVKLLAILVGFMVLAPSRQTLAEDNPGGWVVFVCWKSDSNDKGADGVEFSNCAWDPARSGWDSCYTEHGNKFQHAHTSHGFPYTHVQDGNSFQVTASMSDKHWDEEVYKAPAYSRLSGSTCSRNCFAYATGRSYWVIGIGNILTDEWYAFGSPIVPGVVMDDPNDHMLKITGVEYRNYSCGGGGFMVITETEEKNGTSGVYKRSWGDPNTGWQPSGDVYREDGN